MDLRELAGKLITGFDLYVLYYFVAVNLFYTLLLAFSIPEIFRHTVLQSNEHLKRIFASDAAPAISIIAPAYNEEKTIVASVGSMLALEYPQLEVLVVNDGSKDETLKSMIEAFDLYETPPVFPSLIPTKNIVGMYRSRRHHGLMVIDKENGGKADSLNAGLNAASTPFVCAVDADTLIEQDALLRMVRPFFFKKNVIAVGGTIRVVNGCRVERGQVVDVRPPFKYVPAIQVVEYLRAFLFGRLGMNRLGGNLIISGAFGLFSRHAMIEAGGYRTDTVGEDMELVVRLHRSMREKGHKYTVDFIPDPVAWTEVPDTRRVLGRQRERWHRGLTDTMLRHKKMLFNPRYGAVGMISYPYFFFIEWLSPVIELLGYAGFAIGLMFNLINWYFAGLFFVAAWWFGVVLSLFSIVLEEASFHRYPKTRYILWLMFMAIVESFSYKQLSVFWRVNGIIQYIRGKKSWGDMERSGFGGMGLGG